MQLAPAYVLPEGPRMHTSVTGPADILSRFHKEQLWQPRVQSAPGGLCDRLHAKIQ